MPLNIDDVVVNERFANPHIREAIGRYHTTMEDRVYSLVAEPFCKEMPALETMFKSRQDPVDSLSFLNSKLDSMSGLFKGINFSAEIAGVPALAGSDTIATLYDVGKESITYRRMFYAGMGAALVEEAAARKIPVEKVVTDQSAMDAAFRRVFPTKKDAEAHVQKMDKYAQMSFQILVEVNKMQPEYARADIPEPVLKKIVEGISDFRQKEITRTYSKS